jgi:hypothetical protein
MYQEALAKLLKAVKNRHSGQAKRDPESLSPNDKPFFQELMCYKNLNFRFSVIPAEVRTRQFQTGTNDLDSV